MEVTIPFINVCRVNSFYTTAKQKGAESGTLPLNDEVSLLWAISQSQHVFPNIVQL